MRLLLVVESSLALIWSLFEIKKSRSLMDGHLGVKIKQPIAKLAAWEVLTTLLSLYGWRDEALELL